MDVRHEALRVQSLIDDKLRGSQVEWIVRGTVRSVFERFFNQPLIKPE